MYILICIGYVLYLENEVSSLQNENQQLRESLSAKSRKPPMLPRKTGGVSGKEKVQHDPRLAHVLKTALGIYVCCISDDQYTPVFYWICAMYSSILIYFRIFLDIYYVFQYTSGYLLNYYVFQYILVYFWIFTLYTSVYFWIFTIYFWIFTKLLCISVYSGILLDIYFVYFSIFLDIYYVFQYTSGYLLCMSVYLWMYISILQYTSGYLLYMSV